MGDHILQYAELRQCIQASELSFVARKHASSGAGQHGGAYPVVLVHRVRVRPVFLPGQQVPVCTRHSHDHHSAPDADDAAVSGILPDRMAEIRLAIEEERYPEYKRQKLAGMGVQEVPLRTAETADKKVQEE